MPYIILIKTKLRLAYNSKKINWFYKLIDFIYPSLCCSTNNLTYANTLLPGFEYVLFGKDII